MQFGGDQVPVRRRSGREVQVELHVLSRPPQRVGLRRRFVDSDDALVPIEPRAYTFQYGRRCQAGQRHRQLRHVRGHRGRLARGARTDVRRRGRYLIVELS